MDNLQECNLNDLLFPLNEYGLSPIKMGMTEYVKSPVPILDTYFSVYSSPKIESIVKENFKNSVILRPIYETVERGMASRKIVVGYLDNGKFRFLYDKVRSLFGLKNEFSLGFFDPHTERVYILLDDNISITGKEIFKLDVTLAHELCHYAAFQYKNTNIHNASLKEFVGPFYSYMIDYSIQVITGRRVVYNKDLTKDFAKLIIELYQFNESLDGYVDEKIANSDRIWNDFFKNNMKLDKDVISDIISFMGLSYVENYAPLNIDVRFKQFNKKKLLPMSEAMYYHAYKKLGISKINTVPGQEFLYPSEIIAISNQHGLHSSVANSINKLKF